MPYNAGLTDPALDVEVSDYVSVALALRVLMFHLPNARTNGRQALVAQVTPVMRVSYKLGTVQHRVTVVPPAAIGA